MDKSTPLHVDPARTRLISVRQRRAAAPVNTLDQSLSLARAFSQELRSDAKLRRIYGIFAALAPSPFEAVIAFSLWKARGTRFTSL